MLSHHWHTAVHDSIRQELYGLWVLWHQSQSSPMFLAFCLQTVWNICSEKWHRMASFESFVFDIFWHCLSKYIRFWYSDTLYSLQKIFASLDIWTCVCRGLSAAMTCHWRKAMLLLRGNVVQSQASGTNTKIAHPVCHNFWYSYFDCDLNWKCEMNMQHFKWSVTWYNVIPFQR